VWCSEKLPAGSAIIVPPLSSNRSTIVWPPPLMLLARPSAACDSWRGAPRDDTTSMQPASALASLERNPGGDVLVGIRGRNRSQSWCQAAKVGLSAP